MEAVRLFEFLHRFNGAPARNNFLIVGPKLRGRPCWKQFIIGFADHILGQAVPKTCRAASLTYTYRP